MALKFEVDSLEGIDEGVKSLYAEHNGKYRLQVEGIDPADELKAALKKEREASAEARRKAKEIEDARAESERQAAEKNGEFEKLYKSTMTEAERTKAELASLRTAIADKEVSSEALRLASSLTRDTARANLLAKEARALMQYAEDGVKIKGPDGSAWDAGKLSEHLKSSYPFLVDGSQASGSGASGSGTGGAGNKAVTRAQFDSMNQAQRAAHAKSGGTVID